MPVVHLTDIAVRKLRSSDRYPGVGFRFFAVEIDRNTERIERKNLDANTFGRKIGGYLTVLRDRLYKAHWGVPNLTVLIVTTNATHAANILDFVRKQNDPQYGPRFCLQAEPSFGANWRVPKTILRQFLCEPWATVAGAKDLSRP